jgi:hypothetical protein
VNRAALAAALMLALGCSASGVHVPAPPGGAVAVGPATALAFHQRAEAFYQRLIRRRFNALETFNDPFLRQHFRSVDRFFDYYANLAEALYDADFEKSRPTAVRVEEFVFESSTRVRVQVRFIGEDDRPMRAGGRELVDHAGQALAGRGLRLPRGCPASPRGPRGYPRRRGLRPAATEGRCAENGVRRTEVNAAPQKWKIFSSHARGLDNPFHSDRNQNSPLHSGS